MKSSEIRSKSIEFMKRRGFAVVQPVPLIPENDPTTLFTGSGMQPMVPYLLGEKHPVGTLLTNSQPCIRAQDMDEVGDNRHTTFFEMLGNWSLDGLNKKQLINYVFDFLTKELKLDPKKLYVTCFIGDEKNGIPRDTESAEVWQEVFASVGIDAKTAEVGSAKNGDKHGIKPGERIFFYNDGENWWSRNGGIATTPIGDPCGPCSEVFYDFGDNAHDPSFGEPHPASDSGRFVEICNNVWMEYRRERDGSFSKLEKGKYDFGGGLSRLTAATLDTPDIFKTDLYLPIIGELERLSGKNYDSNQAPMRVIADHLTGAVWLASQGLVSSNKEQGYVMRRLIRRSILKALDLGIESDFLSQCVPIIIEIYRGSYPELASVCSKIVEVLSIEEKAFRKTLGRGLKMLDKFAKMVGHPELTAGHPGLVPGSNNKNVAKGDSLSDWIPEQVRNDKVLSGNDLFMLHDTYGFPLELSVEEAYRREIKLTDNWRDEFDAAMKKQREQSQTATKGMFKGGLEGDDEMTVKYHTAAHLTLAAMHKVLGPNVEQKGSNITPERMRFDFSWPEKLTPEQIKQIEDLVNEWIAADLPVTHDEYDTDFALDEMHAHGSFRDKYGDKVTVYTIGDAPGVIPGLTRDPIKKPSTQSIHHPVSNEICGGPHVEHTGVLSENGEKFKIVKEESSSAGVRRIKAQLIR